MNYKQKILKNSQDHIFSTGINDAASIISRVNMSYGISKIHFVQKSNGFSPKALFISTPDETVTMNAVRWNQGVSYGGKLSWGRGKDNLIILDSKPNCCGMLLAKLSSVPKPRDVITAFRSLEDKNTYIDDIKIKWDFVNGNHFIDVFRDKDDCCYVLLHAGAPEVKGDNIHGMGLYFNESKILADSLKIIKTPFGDCHVLLDETAKEYYKNFLRFEAFGKKRRETAFREVFDGKIILNKTHQGLINMNEVTLGCHSITNNEIFPMSLRSDVPSYIMKAKKSFTDEQIDLLGFRERAERLGLVKQLKNSNIVPHGGGYALTGAVGLKEVVEIKHTRYYSIEHSNGLGNMIVSDLRPLEFAYRGKDILERTVDLKLAEVNRELYPLYTLKI